MKEENKIVIFLRHGECLYPPDIYESPFSIPLSKGGIKNIKQIALKLKNFGIEKIYSSPFLRATQSAEIISKTLQMDYVKEENLSERYLKLLIKMSYKEIEEKYSKNFVNKLLTNTSKVALPGEESLLSAQKRIFECIKFLIKKDNKRILVISHGNVHNLLCCAYLKISIKNAGIFNLYNNHFSIFKYYPNGEFRSIITLNSQLVKNLNL